VLTNRKIEAKNTAEWETVQKAGEVKYCIGQHGVVIRLCGRERIKR
jgi:hypothetical protein